MLNALFLFYTDIPRVSLSTDKKDNKFYVGEDAIITAKFISSLVVCKVVWQKSTDDGSHVHDIDTRLPKYTETRNENGDHLLTIKNCDESDSGTYIPMLSFEKFVFYSDEIVLKVEKGKNVFKISIYNSIYNECWGSYQRIKFKNRFCDKI